MREHNASRVPHGIRGASLRLTSHTHAGERSALCSATESLTGDERLPRSPGRVFVEVRQPLIVGSESATIVVQ
jgi:hypothetical protein